MVEVTRTSLDGLVQTGAQQTIARRGGVGVAVEKGASERTDLVDSARAFLAQKLATAVRLCGEDQARHAEASPVESPFIFLRLEAAAEQPLDNLCDNRAWRREQIQLGPLEWIGAGWDHPLDVGRDQKPGRNRQQRLQASHAQLVLSAPNSVRTVSFRWWDASQVAFVQSRLGFRTRCVIIKSGQEGVGFPTAGSGTL